MPARKNDFLKTLEAFSLGEPAFRVWTLTFGEHRSRVIGEGIEFKDHRPYEPGEDVTLIDPEASLQVGEDVVRENLTEEKVRYAVLLDDSPSLRFYGMRETALFVAGCYLLSAVKGRDPARLVVLNPDPAPFLSPRMHSVDDVIAYVAHVWGMRGRNASGASALEKCSSESSRVLSLANTRLVFISDFQFSDARAVFDRKKGAVVFEGIEVVRNAVGSTYAGGVSSTEISLVGIAPDWKHFENLRGFVRMRDAEDGSIGLAHFTRRGAKKFVKMQYERERCWEKVVRTFGVPMAWVHAEEEPQRIVGELEKAFGG